MNTSTTQRKEADRHQEKSWFSKLISRPEIGPIGVMLLLFGMLGYFSIPAGEMSWNPFTGVGFNALGIRNFLRDKNASKQTIILRFESSEYD